MTDSPDAARIAVGKYLNRLDKPCPTPGCFQDVDYHPILCKGYRFRWYTFKIMGDRLKSISTAGHALSTNQICGILKSSNYREKAKCRDCKASGHSYREALDGIFCHGCGFFIDYNCRQIGYAQEWTTSDNLKLPQGILGQKHCAVCGQPTVSAKFADYFFCSHGCLDHWLSNASRRRTRSK